MGEGCRMGGTVKVRHRMGCSWMSNWEASAARQMRAEKVITWDSGSEKEKEAVNMGDGGAQGREA